MQNREMEIGCLAYSNLRKNVNVYTPFLSIFVQERSIESKIKKKRESDNYNKNNIRNEEGNKFKK